MTGTDTPCCPVDMLLTVAGEAFPLVYDSLQTVPSRTAMQVTQPDTAVDVLTWAGRLWDPAVLCASRTHGECAGGST
jgi:hypothetical protein